MVFPSGGDVLHTHYNYHLGSAYIIAYLRKHGFTAEQFISNELYNARECSKQILKLKPKIVGFTVYEKNYMQCVLISKQLKIYNPDLIIIFGGPTPTVQSREIIETIKWVDLCVRQEGEETVLKLLMKLSECDYSLNLVNLFKIQGITFRNSNQVVNTPDSNVLFTNRLVKNYLDKYPSPYLSVVIPISKAYPIGIITARGCNQNCIYCNCSVLSRKNIYTHSVERIIEELLAISEYKEFKDPIPIYDDAFTIIPERAMRICEAIIENDITLPLLCATRCDMVTKELLDLMKEAGFIAVGFSLESAVPRVLRTIGKVTPPKHPISSFDKERNFITKFKEMTFYAKKIGIQSVFISIMLGLPGESIQDAQKTIDLINTLNIDVYAHNLLRIFKGTPLYKNRDKYGYSVKPISHINNVILENSYPFDVNKIQLGKNCSKIEDNKAIDYKTLKTLSLNTKRNTPKTYFNKVIINSDVIKPFIVEWLQENLAINGAIIQIYTTKTKLMKLQNSNKKTLFGNFSPTMNYESYYWSNSADQSILKSGRMIYYGDQIGLPIILKSTYSALQEYEVKKTSLHYTLCQDNTKSDTNAFYKLLNKISNSGNSFKYLLNEKPLPYFQSICRWTKNQANCFNMEVAIIDDDDSIRICWHSEPIGKLGEPFSIIKQKLMDLRELIIETRQCNTCPQYKKCSKCLFPNPLSFNEFCTYKNNLKTTEPADMIKIFYTLIEYFANPIYLKDF